MTPRRSNPDLWLSFGTSVRPVGRSEGSRCHRHTGLNRGPLRPLAAGPRSRLALAAALVVASLLSPGASGACAGCCDDGSPTVAAPLAAGIAPVHVEVPHGCCHLPGGDSGAAAESCCSRAESVASDSGSSAEEADPCRCNLVPRDEAPARSVRTEPDVRASTAIFTHGLHAKATDVGRIPVAFAGAALPVHARPLRVLYGVWRN